MNDMPNGDVQASGIDSNESGQLAPEAGGKQLCRSCAALNEPEADFCVKCGCPLSSYSTLGPYETIFAQGFIYREAAAHPRGVIAVVGIWLIFLPQAIGGLSMISGSKGFYFQLIGLGAIFISVGIIWRTTSNYLAAKKRANA